MRRHAEHADTGISGRKNYKMMILETQDRVVDTRRSLLAFGTKLMTWMAQQVAAQHGNRGLFVRRFARPVIAEWLHQSVEAMVVGRQGDVACFASAVIFLPVHGVLPCRRHV